ncbi:MAG: hypothetical protein NT015_00150 [Alphaproteobacteria bacterium]|nr:hypothetical protein [Alphaproteobacteria bacterium]
MRAFVLAIALCCAAPSGSMAQTTGPAAPRNRPIQVTPPQPERPVRQPQDVAAVPPATPPTDGVFQNYCITLETIGLGANTDSYFHTFNINRGNEAALFLVTQDGLRLTYPGDASSAYSSHAIDVQWNSLIEQLRAAAGARAMVSINYRNSIITAVSVQWTNRCA